MSINVVWEIANGTAPYMETLDALRSRGWKETSRYIHPSNFRFDCEEQISCAFHYWDANGEDTWISDDGYSVIRKVEVVPE